MNILYAIFVDPFAQMISAPDLLVQTIWEGFVGGVLYALIALGFVLIYKASGVFNFAQGIMMVFAALTLVGLHEKGVPAWIALLSSVMPSHFAPRAVTKTPDAKAGVASKARPITTHVNHRTIIKSPPNEANGVV